jgi:hypothetical protein
VGSAAGLDLKDMVRGRDTPGGANRSVKPMRAVRGATVELFDDPCLCGRHIRAVVGSWRVACTVVTEPPSRAGLCVMWCCHVCVCVSCGAVTCVCVCHVVLSRVCVCVSCGAVTCVCVCAVRLPVQVFSQYREHGVLVWRGFTFDDFANQV